MKTKTSLMTKIFIASESFFFVTLIFSYIYLGCYASTGPVSAQSLHPAKKAIFTVFLLASSFTMWTARKQLLNDKFKAFKGWMIGTLVLGIIFMYGQFTEYKQMMGSEHIFFNSNVFASSFYILTGFHGIHVILGLLILSIMFGLLLSGGAESVDPVALESAEIYWHFVDAVWVFVFITVYLIPLFT